MNEREGETPAEPVVDRETNAPVIDRETGGEHVDRETAAAPAGRT